MSHDNQTTTHRVYYSELYSLYILVHHAPSSSSSSSSKSTGGQIQTCKYNNNLAKHSHHNHKLSKKSNSI